MKYTCSYRTCFGHREIKVSNKVFVNGCTPSENRPCRVQRSRILDTKKLLKYNHHVTVNSFNFYCFLHSTPFLPFETLKPEKPQLKSLEPFLLAVSILHHFLKKRFLLPCLPLPLQHPKSHIIMPPPIKPQSFPLCPLIHKSQSLI